MRENKGDAGGVVSGETGGVVNGETGTGKDGVRGVWERGGTGGGGDNSFNSNLTFNRFFLFPLQSVGVVRQVVGVVRWVVGVSGGVVTEGR